MIVPIKVVGWYFELPLFPLSVSFIFMGRLLILKNGMHLNPDLAAALRVVHW